MQLAQQRLGHDGVANPLWRDEQGAGHGWAQHRCVTSMRMRMFTVFQSVNGRAIRAFGLAGARHIQKHFGVGVPRGHAGQGAGAKHPAVPVEVSGFEFYGGGRGRLRHHTAVSQWAYLGLRPLTMSKNAVWIFSVIGPRLPAPISMRSSSRIGVTSAAVPVKKASSAM